MWGSRVWGSRVWGSRVWGSTVSGNRFWIWQRTHQPGNLESGGLEFRATDFGSGSVSSGGLESGSLESRATDFGSGSVSFRLVV